jgi:hypothetical protein
LRCQLLRNLTADASTVWAHSGRLAGVHTLTCNVQLHHSYVPAKRKTREKNLVTFEFVSIRPQEIFSYIVDG